MELVDVELQAAIVDAAPHDRTAAIMVYADWLQERGDPCGEYLALCAAGQGTDREHELRTVLIGRFASDPRLQLRWSDGFLEQVDIVRSGAPPREELRDVLADLLRLPIARLLRALHSHFQDARSMSELLLAIGPPPMLERLALGPRGGFDGRANPTSADVRPLFDRLPRLRELELCAHTLVLGPAPRLEVARLIGEITDPVLCEVAGWRALRSLYLGYCTSSEYGPNAEATPTGYRLLFDDPPPQLRSLVLRVIPQLDEVCVELAASRLARQLERVELEVHYAGPASLGDRGRAALGVLGGKLTIRTP